MLPSNDVQLAAGPHLLRPILGLGVHEDGPEDRYGPKPVTCV